MKIPLSRLPRPVYDRLRKLQGSPGEYAGYYLSEGGTGCATFGLVITVIGVLGLLAGASSGEHIEMPVYIIATIIAAWIGLASWSYRKRYNASDLTPFTFINPLYLTRCSLDEVNYYSIILDLDDFKRTDNYTNGVYSNSDFAFTFKDGTTENVMISPQAEADTLSEMLKEFVQFVAESAKEEKYENIAGHDIFAEIETDRDKFKDSLRNPMRDDGRRVAGKGFPAFRVSLLVGAIIGIGLFQVDLYQYQANRLGWAKTPTAINSFLNRYQGSTLEPMYHEAAAKEKLYHSYKKEMVKAKSSATKLRYLMNVGPTMKDDAKLRKLRYKLKSEPERIAKMGFSSHLTEAQHGELKKHYQDEGTKHLAAVYKKAIDKYKKVAKKANPKARAAMIQLLTLAQKENKYRVKIVFAGKLNSKSEAKINRYYTSKGYKITPMAPAFTAAKNKYRESYIAKQIKTSFKKIIPEEILLFDTKGDLTFKIGYLVSPAADRIYSLTWEKHLPKKKRNYFRGIKFHWAFSIFSGKKKLYSFLLASTPAMRISVDRRGGTAAIYNNMANSTFVDYKKRILKHFGIPVYIAPVTKTPRYKAPSPKYNNKKMQELLKKYRERLKKNQQKKDDEKDDDKKTR